MQINLLTLLRSSFFLLLAFISGCGFRLDTIESSQKTEQHPLHVVMKPHMYSFEATLSEAFASYGFTLSDIDTSQKVTIQLSEPEVETLAFGNDGYQHRVRSTIRATLTITQPQQDFPQNIQLRAYRDYSVDYNQILGNTNEQTALIESMYSELSNSIAHTLHLMHRKEKGFG